MQSAHAASPKPVSVLLIDNNPADIRLFEDLIPNLRIDSVACLADGLDYLTLNQPDVVLLELDLPDSQGVDGVRRLRSRAPGTAIIALSRSGSEDTGIQAIHHGAQDYLAKDHLDRQDLRRTIRHALERQQSQAALSESEACFRIMFERAAVGLAYVDVDGYFTVVNQCLCDILGYSPPELVRKRVADIIYAENLEKDQTIANRLLTGEMEDSTWETRSVRKDGSIIWADLAVTLVRTETGEPQHFVMVVQDITDRKETEQARLYLAAIVESSEDVIMGKTLDGIITSWNVAAERIYGWTADEIIGRSVLVLFPPGADEEYRHIMGKIGRGESVSQLETKRVRKDGKLIDIALTISPIKDMDGQIIGASTIARDITALKWAQAAREESEQRLRQLTDNIDEVLWLRDVHTGQMLYVSAAFADVWGVARDRLYEQPYSFVEYIHPEDRDRVLEALQQHAEGDFQEEYRIIRPDGDMRWIRAHTLPILNDAGEVYRVAGIAEDITDYKQLVLAEQEQRALAEALRDIANALNSTVDMAEISDRLLTNLKHVVPHDVAEIMLIDGEQAQIVRSRGYASHGLKQDRESPDIVVSETPTLRYMRQTQKPLIIPDVAQTSKGQMLEAFPALFGRSYAGVPIATKDQVLGFINLGSLIPYFFTPIHADRLQAFAEQAAIAIQNARLHEETKELAAHYERQRLARDLHDAMSQTLFAVTITTETLMRQAEQDPASIVPMLAELHQLARGALAETRAVLLELRPESLTDISLESLLEQLRDAVLARKQLRISLELDHTETLDPELKLVLYRIAQEALNNVVKHAQASQVNIRFTQDSAGASFEIRDDGVGFDPDSRSPSSMGLNIMRERAEGVGATLHIRSASSAGTQITVRWENVARKASS